jgi:hypothetical protein
VYLQKESLQPVVSNPDIDKEDEELLNKQEDYEEEWNAKQDIHGTGVRNDSILTFPRKMPSLRR